jgi:hypothetical protein
VCARAQVRLGRTGPWPGGGVCGQNIGGTAVAMAQRRQHAHDKGLFSHDSWPKKGKALARRWCAQRVGAGGKPELGDTRRYKGTAQSQGKGVRAAMTAAAPAKRPARLDGRLSSDGGSMQRRGAGQRSKNGTEDSELTRLGSASARRPSPQQGRGG